jgi:hypothetical protein
MERSRPAAAGVVSSPTWLRMIYSPPIVLIFALSLVGAPIAAAQEQARLFTFSWQFTEGDGMRPRGGTTTGPPVELLDAPADAWRALQEEGLGDFERDRRAILAMAGGYRTTFDFLETVTFRPGYQRARPYQSWATEYVYVDEDRGDFIALQHVLVMFFEGEDGDVRGPVVQKHWRQDWQFEDRDLHVFAGHSRWRREPLTEEEVRGAWSQSVYHVDDSPRYQSLGRWVHDANYSSWTSEHTWRPLPQREHTVRDDYHVLAGTNRHTITPDGWVHEQDNLKVVLDEAGDPVEELPFLARELGVNRYQRITDFDFSAGDAYKERTDAFWADVRDAWAEVRARRDRFELIEERDGRTLVGRMFEYAERLHRGEEYDAEHSRDFIRGVLEEHVD